MSETTNKAPATPGWINTTVGALGRLHCGQSPSSAEVNDVGDGTPYVSGPEQWDGYTIHRTKWTANPARTAPAGSIFITVKGSGVGTLFPGIAAAIGRDIYAFEPHQGIGFRFVYRALQYSIQDLIAKARGDIPGLRKAHILDHPISIPGSSTQEKVASKIDELFSSIDEGERALERVQKLVERYRQSVLKAAVTGELTREWREQRKGQLESGEALLARILKARREAWEHAELDKMKAKGIRPADDKWKQKYQEPATPDTTDLMELPEGWVWATFELVAECLDYAREPVSAKVRSSRHGAIPYYGANGQVGTIDKHLFDEPLILVVEDETFTGRTKPFSYKIEGKSWVNNHAHVLRPTQEVEIDFLNAALMRYPFIPLTTGTTARRKLTQKALMSAPVAIPSKAEQIEIVSTLNLALSATGPTAKDAHGASALAGGLRQAVLRSAFTGRLIAQDPCDEPAACLLERVAGGRVEANAAAPRGRNQKAE